MRSSWLSLVCVLSAAMAESPSAALIEPISQSRSISAQAQVVPFLGESDFDSASDSAPDFGPFQSQVSANAAAGGATASASASQNSVIGSNQVSGSGNADASTGGAVDGIWQGDGDSSLSIRFDVPEAVAFQLGVELFALVGIPGSGQFTSASFELRGGPGDLIIAAGQAFDSLPFLLSTDGVLLAGEYELQANAVALADSGNTTHSQFFFELLVIPEPSTGLLLAAGLLVLGALRRSRA